MDLVLRACDGGTYALEIEGRRLRCATGKGGIRTKKQEGDGATPVGRFPLQRIFFRADRMQPPAGCPDPIAIRETHGWSDDPADPENYNRLVALPYAHSHERLMREDAVYDVVVELGYNDDPPVPGRGSAIFMHVARPDFSGTEGCIALALPDLLDILRQCGGTGAIVVPAHLATG
ncbi:L,D-transpeptidase family protein [Nisaea acidiphila]|uniref:L,D-transpeptidase family protein n=1 Tax=Nisaea acidiphila TaxID=1862145 RepID=A0A9J7AJW1_9PROT|nr:L,D-transpeptidase family protein [Nisaea acidiphila]UUX47955.1 L,D-transpeptidase family protein [Nisaea acidiphila]